MSIYISRAELLKEIENTTWDTECDKAEAHYITTQLEPADVQEVKHGHWVDSASGKFCPWDEQNEGCPARSCHCSVCGEWLTASDEMPSYGYYCPNCGAKMDGGENDV